MPKRETSCISFSSAINVLLLHINSRLSHAIGSFLEMADRKILNLEVNAGLCNRLRALIAGICWAEKLGRTLVVHWPNTKPECMAGFYDLFSYKCLPDFVKVIYVALPTAESCLQKGDAERIFALRASDTEINIKSHGNFWGSDSTYLGNLGFLMPSEHVKSVLNSWEKLGLSSTDIAVHIRMTDNEKAIRLSPFELFVRKLNEVSGPVCVFSDEPRAVMALREMFGARILSFEVVRKRNTLEGMVEAAAVFFALAGKRQIFGSANSSFSEIAREYGGNELVVLRIP